MTAPLNKVEALFEAVKSLRAERRKMERLSEKAFAATGPKQIEKANVDLNFQAFHVRGLESEVHAKAVDCGLADLREAEHYEPSEAHVTGWHRYNFHPALPEAMCAVKS